jgi:AsmA protein
MVFAIALCALPFLIDANHFKTEIAALVKSKTGRDVAFDGDIKLSFFPWIGLKTEKMSLSNKPGFQGTPFITVTKSDFKVKLLPLLSQNFEVDTITLEGLTLNLSKDKQGLNNWDDLIAAVTASSPDAATAVNREGKTNSTPSAFAALTIGGINIQNAHISYDNQQTGKQLELKNTLISTDKLVLGEPVALNMATEASGNLIKIPGSIKWHTTLQLKDKLGHLEFNDSKLEWLSADKPSTEQPLAAVINFPKADINIDQQSLQVSGLLLQSGDIKLMADLKGESIIDKPTVNANITIAPFDPSASMKRWGITLPTSSDARALSSLSSKFQLHATPDLLEFTSLDVNLDDSHATGSAMVNGLTQQPKYTVDLAVDTLDVDRYLTPEKSNLSTPGMALAAGTFAVPLDWLKKLDADGKLALGKLTFNKITMQDIRLTLTSKQGIVKFGQTIKQFYQGSYSGDLNFDAHAGKPELSLDEKFTDIHLEPYLQAVKGKAKMGGTLTSSTQLHGQGSNPKELKSSVAGKVSFFLKEGFIKGFNLEKIIANGMNTVKGGALPANNQANQTQFSEISGTANINKGALQNDDLIAKTATLRGTGKGNVNLNTSELAYTITSRLLKAKATANTPEQLHDTPIVIHLGGTFSKPTFALDAAALLTDKNKAKVDSFLDHNKDKINNLMDKLDKKLGPGGASKLLKKIF